jgi:hypothetical protein
MAGERAVRLKQRRLIQNPMRTVLAAKVESDGAGARLSCRVGVSGWLIAFMVVWLALILAIGAAGAAPVLEKIEAGAPASAGATLVFGVVAWMFLYGVAFFLFGRLLARNEELFLVEFVCRTLEAKEEPAPIAQ